MISYQTVLAQMEQVLMQAKQVQNEQQIREQLTAIRALCDVVLRDSGSQTSVTPVAVQPVLPAMQVPSLSTQKMPELDANGDSIFDF